MSDDLTNDYDDEVKTGNQQQQSTGADPENLDAQIRQLLGDEQVPQYARTLIDLLARELSLLERESLALKRSLGKDHYKYLVRRGAAAMLEEESSWMPDLLTWIPIAIFVFLVFYVLRQWIKGTQFTEKVSARGKVVIVTGANTGIGKQLVRELNLRYAKVYLACRSISKGNDAVRELFSHYGCDMTRMCVRHCDLADFSSVRRFAEEFAREEQKLDILINNAGISNQMSYQKTVDGHELLWQSNHLGPFLLTELLLPMLQRSEDGGRIVNVSSMLHLHADSVNPEVVKSSSFFKSYARSKLANVMHCVELTKRVRAHDSASKVTANAAHPGAVNSEFIRYPWFTKFVKPVVSPLLWYFLKTPQDGAQCPLYLALSKKVDGVSGRYFSDCKEAKVHPLAEDELACELLYNNSLEQCGLDHSVMDD